MQKTISLVLQPASYGYAMVEKQLHHKPSVWYEGSRRNWTANARIVQLSVWDGIRVGTLAAHHTCRMLCCALSIMDIIGHVQLIPGGQSMFAFAAIQIHPTPKCRYTFAELFPNPYPTCPSLSPKGGGVGGKSTGCNTRPRILSPEWSHAVMQKNTRAQRFRFCCCDAKCNRNNRAFDPTRHPWLEFVTATMSSLLLHKNVFSPRRLWIY